MKIQKILKEEGREEKSSLLMSKVAAATSFGQAHDMLRLQIVIEFGLLRLSARRFASSESRDDTTAPRLGPEAIKSITSS